MAFTSTSDAKPASSDLTKISAPPLSIIILTITSLLIAIPMIALSVVNFGMLSIWLNSTVAVLILLYHLVFLIVVFVYRKRFSPASTDKSVVVLFSKPTEDEMIAEWEKMPSKPRSIAFNKWSILALVFLFIANMIAFSIMVDVTTLGAMRGTLPAERLDSHKWNIKIEIAQTTVLGCQLLTIGTLLAISAWGWRCIILDEENRSEEFHYVIWRLILSGRLFHLLAWKGICCWQFGLGIGMLTHLHACVRPSSGLLGSWPIRSLSRHRGNFLLPNFYVRRSQDARRKGYKYFSSSHERNSPSFSHSSVFRVARDHFQSRTITLVDPSSISFSLQSVLYVSLCFLFIIFFLEHIGKLESISILQSILINLLHQQFLCSKCASASYLVNMGECCNRRYLPCCQH